MKGAWVSRSVDFMNKVDSIAVGLAECAGSEVIGPARGTMRVNDDCAVHRGRHLSWHMKPVLDGFSGRCRKPSGGEYWFGGVARGRVFRANRALMLMLMLMGSLAVVKRAEAACFIDNIPSVVLDVGNIVANPGLAVGATVKKMDVIIPGQPRVYCSRTGGRIELGVRSSMGKGKGFGRGNGIFETNIPGLGVMFSGTRLLRNYDFSVAPYVAERAYGNPGDLVFHEFWVSIEFVKTGPLQSGPVDMSGFSIYGLTRGYGGWEPENRELDAQRYFYGLTFGVGNLVAPTCKVMPGFDHLQVDFGGVSKNVFSEVGSTGASRDFDIRLQCAADAYGKAAVAIRIDGSQDPSSAMPGVLRLASGSGNATRIGIKVVQRDEGVGEREITFGKDIMVGSTSTDDRSLVLPLRAYYVQTQSGAVGPGQANGQATFTITYP